MPISFIVPAPVTSSPVLSDTMAMVGSDVRFDGDFVIGPNRDYMRIDGVDAARQSVEAEAQSSPGDLTLTPDWGMGLARLLYTADTKSKRDTLLVLVRARMSANPRIEAVNQIEVFRDAASGAMVAFIDATVAGRRMTTRLAGGTR